MSFIKNFGRKRSGASVFLIALFLSLQALAIFPALHELVHHDANDADHECAVTLFSHGQVDTAATAVPILSHTLSQIILSEPLPGTIFVSADVQLLPSRGPPSTPALA